MGVFSFAVYDNYACIGGERAFVSTDWVVSILGLVRVKRSESVVKECEAIIKYGFLPNG
jgi:hypothetical protein